MLWPSGARVAQQVQAPQLHICLQRRKGRQFSDTNAIQCQVQPLKRLAALQVLAATDLVDGNVEIAEVLRQNR